MHTLRLACDGADREQLIAELWELGTLGVAEYDHGIEAFFDAPFDASRFAPREARWTATEERDWVAESRLGWEPLRVGSRLFLIPDWLEHATPEGCIRVVAHAGQASGSGYSIPTQLTLEMLERVVTAGETVLDVGTGSGILLAAAAQLGAGKCIGCDIDPVAAAAAQANLRGDGVPAHVFAGSPRSLAAGVADLVLANLNAVALIASASELVRVRPSGGRIVACGFREQREPEVFRAFDAYGMREQARLEREAWHCLLLA